MSLIATGEVTEARAKIIEFSIMSDEEKDQADKIAFNREMSILRNCDDLKSVLDDYEKSLAKYFKAKEEGKAARIAIVKREMKSHVSTLEAYCKLLKTITSSI